MDKKQAKVDLLYAVYNIQYYLDPITKELFWEILSGTKTMLGTPATENDMVEDYDDIGTALKAQLGEDYAVTKRL